MGDMFTFVGSQYKVEVGGREFFIDLLLYHRRLRALVALELKIGEFEPEYVGKMQFYLSVLGDTVRLPEEQPSIGIILCKSKNRVVVEYALKDATLPIGVSSYNVTSTVPSGVRMTCQPPNRSSLFSKVLIEVSDPPQELARPVRVLCGIPVESLTDVPAAIIALLIACCRHQQVPNAAELLPKSCQARVERCKKGSREDLKQRNLPRSTA
jgi:hypothetical protein